MNKYENLFIDGKWRTPASGQTISVLSPSTQEPVGKAPLGVEADIDAAVVAARRAFDEGPWPRMSPNERGVILRKLAGALIAANEKIADVMTDEVGTTRAMNLWVGQAGAGLVNYYYADMAEKKGVEEVRQGLNGATFTVRHEPVGVVAAILPWNSPLFMLMAKISPALAAGCTVVVKAPEETPLEFYLAAEAAQAAGLPAGVLNIVAANREVSEYLVRHPGIDKVSFTGSTAAGRKVGAICGNDLKRVTLELGGKSAAVVLDDANPQTVVQYAMGSIMANNGQACMALTRILLPRSRYDEFAQAITAAAKALKVGDPWAADTQIGPLISERQRARVEGYIASGMAEGARITTGGGRPKDIQRGWYVEPTIFVNVSNDMKIAQEEIFGPVLVLIPHDGDEDAVRIANDSIYGLGSAVFTEDPSRGLKVARAVRAGTLGVNNYFPDFGAPGGGFKASGIGREFGDEGFEAYRELKTIYAVDQRAQ